MLGRKKRNAAMPRRALILLAPIALATAIPAAAQTPSPAITAAVADPSRPAEDSVRDANRKPAEVIAFTGLEAGDKVADLIPGGGYFTRIFAKVVGPFGKVYAAVPLALAERPGIMDGPNAIAKANGNVWAGPVDFAKMDFPEPLDMIFTAENYHDFHNIPNLDEVLLNKLIFAALKPGGVYIVEDHSSAAGTGAAATSTLHRIDPAVVTKEAEAAGFVLEGQSNAVANPNDPHTAAVFDPSIRGKTDRFLLKFRKPAS
jgi:predicted methyltransferase